MKCELCLKGKAVKLLPILTKSKHALVYYSCSSCWNRYLTDEANSVLFNQLVI